jgi:hypothetical protein
MSSLEVVGIAWTIGAEFCATRTDTVWMSPAVRPTLRPAFPFAVVPAAALGGENAALGEIRDGCGCIGKISASMLV